MNKYERELVAVEAFTTRLRVEADGYKTRSLVLFVAAAMFAFVTRASIGSDAVTAYSAAVLAVLGVILSANSYVMYVRTNWDMLDKSSEATALRFGTFAIDGEIEIAANAREGRTTDLN